MPADQRRSRSFLENEAILVTWAAQADDLIVIACLKVRIAVEEGDIVIPEPELYLEQLFLAC